MALAGRARKPAQPLEFASFSCEGLAEAEPRALGFTYWFEAVPDGEPYEVAVRFVGRRSDVQGRPGPRDHFEVVRTVSSVIPGSGPVALTTRVIDIATGRWNVTAIPKPLPRGDPAAAKASRAGTTTGMSIASATGVVGFAPLVKVQAPGVQLGAWPGLVGVGTVLALAVQGVLAAQRGLPTASITVISLIACLVGVIGAKVYYLVTHPGEKRSLLTIGMSIQGFVLAAIGTLVVGSVVAGLPALLVLDVTAPGLLLGLTIGRLGCFFGGCCTGIPTAARWGLWSSDRTLGTRRIPVQLFESAMAGVLAIAGVAVVASMQLRPGLVFVANISAYVLGRQLLFPLRSIPRASTHGRVATMVVAALVFLASAVTALVAR